MLVQEENITCARFPPQWNYVVRYALVLLQEENLARASLPPWWNDVVQDVLVLR
jgi:hypothetical protein